jgi:hypothetical protein
MNKLTNLELSELMCFLSAVEKLAKRDYLHISYIEAVKRIVSIVDSNYQKADNVLLERENKEL